ncbi:hypothetical protein OEA41_010757 [Lepraria neglecta]|uniref:Uncharacterized protein n=1 Tax=Lepraria neglecta TaxID=209136 RepID=A0AAD9YX68_9LECA|nr:hypothetical protein OEA41_010757 [Lepraria neglecta]
MAEAVTASIASLGSFQDGGLRHNNPTDLALWECPKLWPSSTSPDVVVSLGTGMDDNPSSPKAPKFRHVFNDGFIPRLFRLFMSSLDGERSSRDLVNRLDDSSKADYFRLNVSFRGDEPRLDDVQCMEDLRRSVQLQPDGPKDRASIVFALLVASFYLELDTETVPAFEANRYCCRGFLRCRNDSRAVLNSLAKIHSNLEFITDFESLGTLTLDDICSRCHLYCRRVQFSVRHPDDVFSINLKVHGLEQRKISGFPHSVTWFIHQQQIDAQFGNAAHDKLQLYRCCPCGVFSRSNDDDSKAGRKQTLDDSLSSPGATSEAARKRKKGGQFDTQVVPKRRRV